MILFFCNTFPAGKITGLRTFGNATKNILATPFKWLKENDNEDVKDLCIKWIMLWYNDNTLIY